MQTAGLLTPSSKSLLSREVIVNGISGWARGRGAGKLASLSLRSSGAGTRLGDRAGEDGGSVSTWGSPWVLLCTCGKGGRVGVQWMAQASWCLGVRYALVSATPRIRFLLFSVDVDVLHAQLAIRERSLVS